MGHDTKKTTKQARYLHSFSEVLGDSRYIASSMLISSNVSSQMPVFLRYCRSIQQKHRSSHRVGGQQLFRSESILDYPDAPNSLNT